MTSMSAAFFRKKLPEADGKGPKLLQVLSAWDLTLMGIGAIIGTGIFVLTGHAAAGQAGPAVVLSFVVSGFACAFAALAYAELAAAVGGCGSAYGYSYAAFGELIAWIIGWDLLLEYGLAVATVANGWSGYFNRALKGIGMELPAALTKGPFATKTQVVVDAVTKVSTTVKVPDPGIINFSAVAIILILMGLLIAGVKASARLNAAMVFIKLLTVAVFICVAVGHVDTALWQPFMPFGWFTPGVDGGQPIGILGGASVVFFAYIGFDAVSTAVEETANPQRDAPIGILGSLAFCTVIYIIVSGLLTGIVSYKELGVDYPVAFALEKIGFKWASAVIVTGVIFGLTTVMLVLYYGMTRIIFSISRDGLLPPKFSEVNAKTHTPIFSTVLCGILMAAIAGLVPLDTLSELVSVGTLAAFVLVCIGVMFLRKQKPNMKRPFVTPGGYIIPILGALSCAALICFLSGDCLKRFVYWLVIGFVVYFIYGIKHSKLNKKTR